MALTPNEAYAAKQPFVDKETLEHIVEQFPTPFHLYDEAGIRRNMQEVRDAFAGTRALRNTLPSRLIPTRRSSPFSTNTAAAAIARVIPSS